MLGFHPGGTVGLISSNGNAPLALLSYPDDVMTATADASSAQELL